MAADPLRPLRLVLAILLGTLSNGAVGEESAVAEGRGKNTVLWISADGLRADYPDRARTPFLDRLREEGASTRHLIPTFPSITFSVHVSKATGAPPGVHGITGNAFYDTRTRRTYQYPGDEDLLEAEPIWRTAARQGIRTAVLDWPLAHNQQGPLRAAYFGERYDRGLDDGVRLDRILDIWETDEGDPPLRLLLGYLESPDNQGHAYGPEDPLVTEAVEQLDRLLADAWERTRAAWQAKKPAPEDNLYLVVSSDHGMSRVKTLVHPERLTGFEGREDVTIVTTGNIANIHLDRIPAGAEREQAAEEALARISRREYARGFRRDEIPEEWGLRHPWRTGDLLIVLEIGYTFSSRPREIEESVDDAGGPLGMHGYNPAQNPEMLTPLYIYRERGRLGGLELGRIHALQLHSTVCRILGIHASPKALADPIDLDVPVAW